MNYDLLQTTDDPSAFKQFYIIPKYYNTGGLLLHFSHRDVPKNRKKKHWILILTPEKQDPRITL